MHTEIPGAVFRYDHEVAQVPVLDRKTAQAAPILPSLHQGQANPRFPLQCRHPVHWPGLIDIAGKWHAAKHIAHGAQAAFFRFVQERRHLHCVPSHQQEALAALGQTADFAAVVGGFSHSVTVMPEQLGDLVQQVPAAGGQARNVFEHDQLHWIVLPGFAHQPHTSQCQLVECPVFGCLAHGLGQ